MIVTATPVQCIEYQVKDLVALPEQFSPAADSPCMCGGVLVFSITRRAYLHVANCCVQCATDGYEYCGPECANAHVQCDTPTPVPCPTCDTDLTVEGCDLCGTLGENTGEPDPDHAYDLYRERDW